MIKRIFALCLTSVMLVLFLTSCGLVADKTLSSKSDVFTAESITISMEQSDGSVFEYKIDNKNMAIEVSIVNGDDEAYSIFAHLADRRTTAEGTEAYYRLIERQYELANLDVAEQMIYDLGECGSVYWQAKAFLLLGDIMIDRNNAFQARATYQSIVDGYPSNDDGIIDEAKARINSMK
jgi:hypothetical protein